MNGFSKISPTDFPVTCTTSYRFSFNGQEKVDEISGAGNHNTALFWEYDTRLGRRWNLDPKPNPSISNYATFANNPIYYMDLLGDTLRGSSASDASKMVNEMKSIFGSTSELFNKHFKLGSDGKTFEKIKNVREFNKWLHGKGEYKGTGSGFTKEQIALANGFMKTINSGFNIEVNFSPGASVFKASSSTSGTAYIGDENGNFTDQNGEVRAYSQTQTFVHEVLGEGYTATMYGDLEKSEAFTEMGQRGLLNKTQMRLFNAEQVQIIQIENLYNAAHGYLRTGLGRNANNEPFGGHFLNPSDMPNIGLIPANFSSSFYVKGDWIWTK